MTECIFCHEYKIVKNGSAPSGEQSFHCNACISFFTGSTNPEYTNHSFDGDTMKFSVFWNPRYPLIYRNPAEMMALRKIDVPMMCGN